MKYIDTILPGLANKEFYRGIPKPKYWTTKDGKKIQISNMETSHIVNSLNLLKKHRQTNRFNNMISDLEAELAFRKKNKKR